MRRAPRERSCLKDQTAASGRPRRLRRWPFGARLRPENPIAGAAPAAYSPVRRAGQGGDGGDGGGVGRGARGGRAAGGDGDLPVHRPGGQHRACCRRTRPPTATAVARHHDLLRGAVEAHGGAVFETVGDAVYAAFARPTDAVAAALAGQLALQRRDWGALGRGPSGADGAAHGGGGAPGRPTTSGAPLYRCARLMATAHGGQVVLSEAAAVLVRDALPARAGLLDLGEYRLKDLQRPERVFQLTAPGLPGDFPALRTLDALPHNLPLPGDQLRGAGAGAGGGGAAPGHHPPADPHRHRGHRQDPPGPAGGGGGHRGVPRRRLVRRPGPAGRGGAGARRRPRRRGRAGAGGRARGAGGAGGPAGGAPAPLAGPAAAGQLRAPAGRLRPPGGRRAPRLPRGAGAGHQPGAAGPRRGDRLARPLPGPARPRRGARPRRAGGLRGRAPVPGAGPRRAARLRPHGRQRPGRGRGLRPPGRDPPGPGAGRRPGAGADPGAARGAAGRPLPAADRGRAHRPAPAADPAGHGGLEPRPAGGAGAGAVPAPGRLPRAARRGASPWRRPRPSAPGRRWRRADVLDLLTGLVDKSLVLAEARGAEERYRLLETLRQYAEERLLQAGEAAAVRDRHAAWCLDLGRAIAAAGRPARTASSPGRPAAARGAGERPRRARLVGRRPRGRCPPAWSCSPPPARWAWARRGASPGAGWSGSWGWRPRAPRRGPGACSPSTTSCAGSTSSPAPRGGARGAGDLRGAGRRRRRRRGRGPRGAGRRQPGRLRPRRRAPGAALARARARGDWVRIEHYARDLGVVALARGDLPAARARLEESRALAERHGLGPLVASGSLRLAILDRLEGDYPRARARLEALRRSAAQIAGAGGRPGRRTCWRWSWAAWPGPRGATTRRGPTSTARCGASTGGARAPCCAPRCAWPAWRRSPAARPRGG